MILKWQFVAEWLTNPSWLASRQAQQDSTRKHQVSINHDTDKLHNEAAKRRILRRNYLSRMALVCGTRVCLVLDPCVRVIFVINTRRSATVLSVQIIARKGSRTNLHHVITQMQRFLLVCLLPRFEEMLNSVDTQSHKLLRIVVMMNY